MAWSNSLHEAVGYDKPEDIEKLIKDGADVNKRDGSNRTPLDCCVSVHASYQHIAMGTEEGELV